MAETEETVTEIQHQITIANPLIKRFKNQIQYKEVVVCMGNTRSGKSTLINYIQGNELEAFKDTKRTCIKERNSRHCGPGISHGSVSYTKLPSVWELNNQFDRVIVDVPGFDDNRGVAHDIVNTLYFNQLKHARRVKFVLVSDINDIDTDNVQAFTKAMSKLQGIMNDLNELKYAVSVVFTKDDKNYRQEDIAVLLKKKIVNVHEMQVKKDLICHLVRNIDQIGIFKMPAMEGIVVKEEVDCNIEGAIFNNNLIAVNITGINFNPSEQAHHVLLEIYQKYVFEIDFINEIKKLTKKFDNYFNVDKYVFASTEDELGDTKLRLQYILPRIATEKTKTFIDLTIVNKSLLALVGNVSQDVDAKLRFLAHMNELSLLDENVKQIAIIKYKNALSKLEDEINMLISKIDKETEDRTTETVRYVLSQAASDQNKLIVTGASLIPVAKKTLETVGIKLPESLEFEIVKFSGLGCGIAGAGAIGVAAGGYAVLYYKTIYLRQKLRKEQGR